MKLCLTIALLLLLPAVAWADPVSFKRDVAPLLLNNCLACHGPKKAEGGYRIDTFERALAAGDSTQPGFIAGKLDESEAFRRIVSTDKAERMPLDGDPLPRVQPSMVPIQKRPFRRTFLRPRIRRRQKPTVRRCRSRRSSSARTVRSLLLGAITSCCSIIRPTARS
jgi:hypothetical protein